MKKILKSAYLTCCLFVTVTNISSVGGTNPPRGTPISTGTSTPTEFLDSVGGQSAPEEAVSVAATGSNRVVVHLEVAGFAFNLALALQNTNPRRNPNDPDSRYSTDVGSDAASVQSIDSARSA